MRTTAPEMLTDAWLQATADRYGLDDGARYDIWRSRFIEDEREIDRSRSISASIDGRGTTVADWSAGQIPGPTQPFYHLPAVLSPIGDSSALGRVQQAMRAIDAMRASNSFVHVFESAADRARALDARESTGALAGRIVAVKDMFDIEGYIYSAGTHTLAGQPAVRNAPTIQRLLDHDAIVIGTTNMHALAFGAISHSSDFGIVDNPRRPGYMSGGSSGGSAAAVAAGAADIALGTDTGGSIRIPAALCGIVGFKPTFGRIPRTGLLPLGTSLDHVGPMARTVDEVKLAFDALSGTTPSRVQPTSLAGRSVGILGGHFREHLQPEVDAALVHAANALTAAGAHLIEIDVAAMRMAPGVMVCTLPPEAITNHHELLRAHADELFDDVRLRFESAMFRTAGDYVLAQQLRSRMRTDLDAAFATVDYLLAPTTPIVAQPHHTETPIDVGGARWTAQQSLTRLTTPFNLTGHPALSLPWRLDAGGGGIGVQLVGARDSDQDLLGFAAAMEQIRPNS